MGVDPSSSVKNPRVKDLLRSFALIGHEVAYYGLRGHRYLRTGRHLPFFLPTEKQGITWYEFINPQPLSNKLTFPLALFHFLSQKMDIILIKHPCSAFLCLPRSWTKIVLDYEDVMSVGYALEGNQKLSVKYRYYEKLAGRIVDVITTENDRLREYLIELGIPEDKIGIVPNGVDTKLFDPNRYNKTTVKKRFNLKGPVAGFVGLTVQRERLELLLEAIPHILKHVPNAHFLLIGPEAPWFEPYKKKYRNHIQITGYVPHNKVPELLSTVDVAINPLVTKLPQRSSKNLEYLSMKKPVVATNYPTNEHVWKSRAGVVTEADPHTFAEAIIKLLTEPEKAERLGQKGRSYAKQYDWIALAKRILFLIMR